MVYEMYYVVIDDVRISVSKETAEPYSVKISRGPHVVNIANAQTREAAETCADAVSKAIRIAQAAKGKV